MSQFLSDEYITLHCDVDMEALLLDEVDLDDTIDMEHQSSLLALDFEDLPEILDVSDALPAPLPTTSESYPLAIEAPPMSLAIEAAPAESIVELPICVCIIFFVYYFLLSSCF